MSEPKSEGLRNFAAQIEKHGLSQRNVSISSEWKAVIVAALRFHANALDEPAPSASAPGREPIVTDEMIEAGSRAIDDYYDNTKDAPFEGSVAACYRAMYAARPSPAAGECNGWQLVPIEPTSQMFAAGRSAGRANSTRNGRNYRMIYQAMLKAAPSSPAGNTAGTTARNSGGTEEGMQVSTLRAPAPAQPAAGEWPSEEQIACAIHVYHGGSPVEGRHDSMRRALLAARPSPAAGEWQTVPRTPTEEMRLAGQEMLPDGWLVANSCYCAMLKVAPLPPTNLSEAQLDMAEKAWVYEHKITIREKLRLALSAALASSPSPGEGREEDDTQSGVELTRAINETIAEDDAFERFMNAEYPLWRRNEGSNRWQDLRQAFLAGIASRTGEGREWPISALDIEKIICSHIGDDNEIVDVGLAAMEIYMLMTAAAPGEGRVPSEEQIKAGAYELRENFGSDMSHQGSERLAERVLRAAAPVEGPAPQGMREALIAMRERDDRNGSLPKAYRDIIDAALSAPARDARGADRI